MNNLLISVSPLQMIQCSSDQLLKKESQTRNKKIIPTETPKPILEINIPELEQKRAMAEKIASVYREITRVAGDFLIYLY